MRWVVDKEKKNTNTGNGINIRDMHEHKAIKWKAGEALTHGVCGACWAMSMWIAGMPVHGALPHGHRTYHHIAYCLNRER